MGQGLICIGLTTLDIHARPIDTLPTNDTTALVEQIAFSPAGTAGGAALVAAVLGVRTSLASSLGADAAGRLVRAELAAAGVDTALLAERADLPTSTTILLVDSTGHRPNIHALGAGSQVDNSPVLLQAARAARFVHFAAVGSPQLRGEAGAALLAAAREAGAFITCDLISPHRRTLEQLTALLPFVDVFMPNAGEARLITGRDDLADAAAVLIDLGARACVFKDGAQGSILATGEGLRRFAAHPITPVDTTSCGDSFCAGFIAALDRGWPIDEAVRLGGAVAALVAQGLGTLGALKSFDQAQALMRELQLQGSGHVA